MLVPGLAGAWRWWSPVFETLGERRRVHAVDLPRLHGATSAVELSEWLCRWLEAAELEHVDLAGHSRGGLVAAELAATHPEPIWRKTYLRWSRCLP